VTFDAVLLLARLCELRDDPQAERLYQDALYIQDKYLGRDHPKSAFALHDLGGFYARHERPEEAMRLMHEASLISDKAIELGSRFAPE
jgi:hypothetical protein